MSNANACNYTRTSMAWAVGIVASIAVFAWFVARPQMATARGLASDIEAERAALATRVGALQLIEQARNETAVLSARLTNFAQRIPNEPQVGDFIKELARLAQNRRLQADTVEPGEPVRTGDFVALPIAIKARGSFTGIHGLLADIEQLPRLTRFEQFKAVVDPEHPTLVTAEFNLKIFYLPPESEFKTPNQQQPVDPPTDQDNEAQTG